MNFIKRLTNKALDIMYKRLFPHVNNTCRISHKARVGERKNLYMEAFSNISVGSDIMNTRAKVIIGKHFVCGPKLTIITGDHMPVVGRFLSDISDADKDALDVNHEYDQDVTIEDDVWTGYGVTIMKGVTIGRGAIVAAGSIVTRSLPPYCIAAGIPARPIKFRWTIEQILEHEAKLYPENERFTREQLDSIIG